MNTSKNRQKAYLVEGNSGFSKKEKNIWKNHSFMWMYAFCVCPVKKTHHWTWMIMAAVPF